MDIGLFLNREIKNFEPIQTDWSSISEVKLINKLIDCGLSDQENISDGWVLSDEGVFGEELELSYLALNENLKIVMAYRNLAVPFKVQIGFVREESGGSMGYYRAYGIYGIADIPDFGTSMVPLKFLLRRMTHLILLMQKKVKSY